MRMPRKALSRILFLSLVFSLSFPSYARIVENGKPSQALKDLIQFLKIGNASTLDQTNELLQKRFKRAGQNSKDTRHEFDDRREELLARFKMLDLVDKMSLVDQNGKLIMKESFDYGLLAGGFFISMADRLNFLFETVESQEISLKKLIVMVGQRDLDTQVESAKNIKDLEKQFDWLKLPVEKQIEKDLKTAALSSETGLAKYLLQHTQIPARLKTTEIVFIDSPKKTGPAGETRRPNTADTLRDFVRLHFQGGKVLLATSQPFGEYMEIIANKILATGKKPFTLHVIASQPFYFKSIPTGIFLDYIARAIYATKNDADKL